MTGRKFFLNAINGAFSEIPEEGQHQHQFDEITGRLLHVRFKETKKGEAIRLYIVDENNLYIVSLFVKSNLFNAFAFVSPSLDLHSEIKFRIKREKGFDHLTFHQFGNSVRWYFDNGNKNQLPQDKEERTQFLRSIIENELSPALEKIVNPFPYHSIYKPMGSGNGLHGGYFGKGIHTRHKAVSNAEVTAAGYTSRQEYINSTSRHIHRK